MDSENNGFIREEPGSISIRDWISKYLVTWPIFLICIMLSTSSGLLYIRYTLPQYVATTSYVVKGAESGKSNSGDLIESALNGKMEANLNNEMRLVKAASLMERAVVKNNFNVSYFKKGRILNIDIYNDAPFLLSAKHITDSVHTYKLYVKKIYLLGGNFLYGPDKAERLYTFHWNVPFIIGGQNFVLTPKRKIENEEGEYIIQWIPVAAAVAKISEDLSVNSFDTKSSVIQLTIKTENIQKGQDILNALFTEYNLSDIDKRNKLFERTVQFIDDRLLAISGDLRGVEGNLENYQGSNKLIDIKSQTAQSLGNSNEISNTIKDLSVQQSVSTMIQDYFNNPIVGNKLVPSSLGLSDATLDLLVSKYNELQLQKEREAPSVAPNSTVMQDLNTQLVNLKSSILENLKNINKNLQLKENDYQRRNNQYQGFLSSIPHNERSLQEIKRKQSITEGLYLYLLQKREETAILGTASNVAHYEQIDPASGYGPVEPNAKKIIIYSAILGILAAGSLVYIRELLNDTIGTNKEVIKRVPLPIVGEIGHISKKGKQFFTVAEQSVVSEQFRTLRTNISFSMGNINNGVILVTSSVKGEGKSFVSKNLAAVFATPGKKVALLKFDLRKPVEDNHSTVANDNKGITGYLTGRVNILSEIVQVVEDVPGLYIFPTGPTLFNPADLLVNEKLSELFRLVKENYDHIIVDSPPLGPVSDSLVLGKYSDMVLYVIRQRTTQKKQLEFVNDINYKKKLNNMALVINDVKTVDGYGNDNSRYNKYKN